ncbi:zinc-binding metallopeptidase [Zunongwangia sp.]|uniref:zinc-binding metallopeptidase n=1 Tax=Zunongwangia sp. TaxID=1965325 RepID=UPI003AA8A71A
MKNYILKIAAIFLVTGIISCSDDDEIKGDSILDTETPELTPLDNYIRDNFVYPYNIEVVYRWEESEFDLDRYLYPPELEKVRPSLEIIKSIWLDSYTEVGGENFIKNIAPRQLALSGGFNINPEGTITLGLAEGGKKIVFFNVDFLDSSNKANVQQFLGTIQHEYTHILNQTKPFDEQSFGNITPTSYTANWSEGTDAEANELGFVSAYARSQVTEDFAEMVHFFLNYDNDGWNNFIDSISNAQARSAIRAKETIMADYFDQSFDIDVYELQKVVARNTEEIVNQ